jgi:hypothetical protein
MAPVAPARKTVPDDYAPAATPSTSPKIDTTPSDMPKTISPEDAGDESFIRLKNDPVPLLTTVSLFCTSDP